jgi:hypothetical protein
LLCKTKRRLQEGETVGIRRQLGTGINKALEEMRAGGLTQHPNNYTLWYTFVSEAIPDLTLAITSLDKKQEPVSEHHCAELHQKSFPRPGKKPPLSARLKIIQSNDNSTQRYHRSR